RLAWRGAAGVADLATGRPMRPDLRHRVGSITKTFVATALLQLVGEGRLRLADPVARWFPRLAGLDPRVTVRMLLNHTSGINDYDHVIFADPAVVEEGPHYTPWQLVAIGLDQPPTGAPGATHSYSNTNYILAGLLLERLTGRDAAAEVTRRVLRPLGLRDTYFPGASPRIRGPHSRAYVPWVDGQPRDFTVYDVSWAWMAGGLISTTAELNRFYRALLGGKLLRPAQLAEMRRTVPVPPVDPSDSGYGLGLLFVALPCGTFWGHDGSVLGHITISLHSPDGRRQVSYAMNLSHYQTDPDALHPIDAALYRFLGTALCGPEPAAPAAAPERAGAVRSARPSVTLPAIESLRLPAR
ncbi:MAG TPA: serine hydrolase domain-containing protein, partial [Pilimelia sp.]|nr:serine hydrolase domain-containing protein [Pilimelia sp.]